MARQEDGTVMLSAAKHLDAMEPDPSLHSELALNEVNGVTTEPCHAERSEASRRPSRQTLRCAQGDKKGPPSPSGILDLCLRLMHITADLSALDACIDIRINL